MSKSAIMTKNGLPVLKINEEEIFLAKAFVKVILRTFGFVIQKKR